MAIRKENLQCDVGHKRVNTTAWPQSELEHLPQYQANHKAGKMVLVTCQLMAMTSHFIDANVTAFSTHPNSLKEMKSTWFSNRNFTERKENH